LIRRFDFYGPLFVAAPVLALVSFAASGCREQPSAASSAANQLFSTEELAEMRKSVRSQGEFRQLLKIKTAERNGSAVVKTKVAAGKARRN
jgi:hypothetical protein